MKQCTQCGIPLKEGEHVLWCRVKDCPNTDKTGPDHNMERAIRKSARALFPEENEKHTKQ